jgi:hypothetical protein
MKKPLLGKPGGNIETQATTPKDYTVGLMGRKPLDLMAGLPGFLSGSLKAPEVFILNP